MNPEPYATASTVEDFERHLSQVRGRIAAAAERSGRSADEIRLLPVSKTVSEERIRAAVTAGMTSLGENKVQEAARKAEALSDLGVEWSIIGHLQRNKARDVARFASEFQALDSLRLAETLERRLELESRTLDVFVQVNTSNEPQKYGLAQQDVPEFLQQLRSFERLQVQGLMTLAIFSHDTDQVRPCFQRLRKLRDQVREHDADLLGPGELSMGMSGDFELAIEEGATVVRVGQAIFGARSTPDSHYWPTPTS